MVYLSSKCVSCEHTGGLALARAVDQEIEKLDDERDARLDAGESLEAIGIDFENRLWRMEKQKCDTLDPAFIALETAVRHFRFAFAKAYYEKNGWHRKYSGEWVKKED